MIYYNSSERLLLFPHCIFCIYILSVDDAFCQDGSYHKAVLLSKLSYFSVFGILVCLKDLGLAVAKRYSFFNSKIFVFLHRAPHHTLSFE